jgi:hypothetical protein
VGWSKMQSQSRLSQAGFGGDFRRAVTSLPRWRDGFEWPVRRGRSNYVVTPVILFRCYTCRSTTSLAANTVLASIAMPLHLPFRDMYGLVRRKYADPASTWAVASA